MNICIFIFEITKKYNVESLLQNKDFLNKMQNTMMQRYEVSNAMHLDIFKDKMKKTCMEKYGVEYYSQTNEFKEKFIKTNLDKYGVEYYLQTEECKEKKRQTSLKNYGFEYPFQNAELLHKLLINRCKDYKLPSGKNIKLDGFENNAMDILLKTYSENEIETCLLKVPAIIYKTNIKRVYYPDIYIKKENKIIEVKSDWIYKLDKNKNLAKKEACLKAGYKFEFWIFNKKGKLIDEKDL